MNTPADIRINARLTGEDAERFQQLLGSEGLTASELLRAALREYHERHAMPARDALSILEKHAFLAGGEGPEDLSSAYKSYLTEALETKIPMHAHEPLPVAPKPRRRRP